MALTERKKEQKLAELYWTKRLVGLLAQPRFNTSMVKEQSGKSGQVNLQVPFPLETKALLNKVSKGSDTSAFVLLISALQVTYHRYFQFDDVLIATPGFPLKNTQEDPYLVFLRIGFAPGHTALDIINAVQQELFEIEGKGILDIPSFLKQIVRNEAIDERGLFNLFFASEPLNKNHIAPEGTGVALIYGADEDVLKARVDTHCHELDFVRQFMLHFMEVLKNMLSNVHCSVDELTLLPKVEREQITIEFKTSPSHYDYQKTVVELFEKQVETVPLKDALSFDNQVLSYNEMNRRVNRLANGLVEGYGIGKGDFVGIMVGRTEWLVVGLLAIMKTGAAFVPIDVATPTERATFIINDCKAKLLLRDGSFDGELTCENILINEIENENEDNPLITITPEDIVFAIYTSGSTGVPKGVLQTYRCISNLLQWQINNGHFEKGLKVLQWSSIAFDACIHEVLFALLTGGQICLVDEETRRDPVQLGQFIIDQQIEVFWQAASALNVLFEVSHDIKSAGNIKHIVSTGEQLSVGRGLRDFLLKFPYIRLHNFYGPTETHVVTARTLTNTKDVKKTYQPIGRPIPNVEVFILDRYQELVPIGVEGELYVGGACMAVGYMNLPELTEERFVKFPEISPNVLYKTGDRCRWMKNGEIEYLGRNDDQVKIRGQRVETGEVESLLLEVNEIEEVIVVAKEDIEGNNYLVAYYVAAVRHPEEVFTEFLKKKVPDYFIPSFFIKKEALPLTSSGKINKRLLKNEREEEIDSNEQGLLPSSPTERKVNELWNIILNKKGRIGVKRDFFKVGGHSLKATRLVSLIFKEMGVSMTLREIFENPTIEEQAALIDRVEERSIYSPIKVVPQREYYEVTHAQKRLWVLDQLEEEQVAYNMPGCFTLTGTVDFNALKQALYAVVARHEILRTTFVLIEGVLKQRVHAVGDFPFVPELVDLSDVEDKTGQVGRLLKEESTSSFKLDKGPLLRARLLKLEERQYIFLLTLHHIICDGWSQDILMRELVTLYNACKKREHSPLPELKIQYKDYAFWQNQQLEAAMLREHESFWFHNLEGELPLLELPTDCPRPQYQTFNGDFVTFEIQQELASKLYTLAKGRDATLFMVLLSTVYALFHRYTDQEDIILGTPIAGREHFELENQLGLYVNTLALRTRFSGDDTFTSLLKKVKETTLDAYEHQVYPFDFLVDRLEVSRLVNRNPIFDVMVALQNAHDDGKALPAMDGVHVESSGIKDDASKFDIWLSFSELGKGISGMLQYNTDLFHKDRMLRFCGHFLGMLEAIVSTPDRPINRLEYLPKIEKEQLLLYFNQTDSPFPEQDTIVSLFEKQVEASPGAIALTVGEKSLSFTALNQQCNRLAHHLRAYFCLSPGEVLGMLFEDPMMKIVSLLGTLKAGAAYVPISPRYPRSRVKLIVEDSRAKGVLSEKKLERLLEGQSPDRLLFLDGDFQMMGYPDTNPERVTGSNDLMYVIYTSGSTGTPKGCELNHKGVVNRIHWMWKKYGFNNQDVVLQKTPLIFDVSVWEIFMPLCFGGRLVGCKREEAMAPESLLSIIQREQVTTMHFVPSLMEIFMKSLNPQTLDHCRSLQKLILSGEALSPQMAKRFRSLLDIPLHNLYGPTEASVDVTFYEVPEDPQEMFIGQPIDNTAMYVLDRHLQPVPLGIKGEIYISGVGLARGYRGNELLTKQKFLESPFKSGERLYKTGDIGIWMPSGHISYCGRNDEQIKIRGQRIEPVEIETTLSTHPSVDKAVVKVYRKDDESHFAAFVLCSDRFEIPENITDNQVTEWEKVFDHVYDEEATIEVAESNFQGWVNSYTNEAFSNTEMEAWLREITDLINDYRPDKVLEIGCGTGLVLFQVAPMTEKYVGTDISSRSINYVNTVLDRLPHLAPKVALHQRPAHDFSGFTDKSFDCVILNSVIQYFPDAKYLQAVLEAAIRVVKPGGKIVVGDVRSKALLRHFHYSVQKPKLSKDLSLDEFRALLRHQVSHDKELLVHPHFFFSLGVSVPDLAYVEIRQKEGEYHNELSKYRYQAILHIGEGQSNPTQVDWHAYDAIVGADKEAWEFITNSHQAVLGILAVPNADLHLESEALSLLDNGQYRRVSDLDEVIDRLEHPDPEGIWSVLQERKKEMHYDIYRFWGNHHVNGGYDIILIHKDRAQHLNAALLYYDYVLSKIGLDFRPLSEYTSHPVHDKAFSELVPKLRAYLMESLPLPMVPTVFLSIEEIPLTPSGKVDKKALKVEVKERAWMSTTYTEARNHEEEKMLAIWKDVLNEERIGVEDNFFELGGHSLKAVQLVSRIHKEFSCKLELRTVFAFPTIVGLLEQLRDYEEDPFEPLTPIPSQQYYEVSHAQNRLWILNQFEESLSAYNMPGAYNITGKLDIEAFERSFQSLVERHESLRTSFVFIDDELKQKVHEIADISFKMEYLDFTDMDDADSKLKELLNMEVSFSFDIAQAPLIRAKLIALRPDNHVFLINMHHIISDGWSFNIIAKEMLINYDAFRSGENSGLPDLDIQYKEFAAWQNRYLKGERFREHREYWKGQLSDIPILELNTDFDRPDIRTFEGVLVQDGLGEEILCQLHQLGQQQGCTLFMTLVSCVKALLFRYTGQEDIAIGSPVAGRNHKDLEGLVGFFVNILVLRTQFDGSQDFVGLLEKVREVILKAYEHQEYPFDKLVDEFAENRDLSRSPFFDVNVVLQNTDFSQVEALAKGTEGKDIQFHPVELEIKASKFDLIFDFREFQGRLLIQLEYNKDLFKRERMVRLVKHFKALVGAVLEEPRQPINSLNYLTKEERDRILSLAQGK